MFIDIGNSKESYYDPNKGVSYRSGERTIRRTIRLVLHLVIMAFINMNL